MFFKPFLPICIPCSEIYWLTQHHLEERAMLRMCSTIGKGTWPFDRVRYSAWRFHSSPHCSSSSQSLHPLRCLPEPTSSMSEFRNVEHFIALPSGHSWIHVRAFRSALQSEWRITSVCGLGSTAPSYGWMQRPDSCCRRKPSFTAEEAIFLKCGW